MPDEKTPKNGPGSSDPFAGLPMEDRTGDPARDARAAQLRAAREQEAFLARLRTAPVRTEPPERGSEPPSTGASPDAPKPAKP